MNIKANYIVWVLFISYSAIGLLFYFGMKEPKVSIDDEKVVFSGMYGEEIPFSNIRNVALTDQLPELKSRNNGFSLGSVKRGYYKTKQKEKVKLLMFDKKAPYLLIEFNSGFRLFYNSKKSDVTLVYQQLAEKTGVSF